MRFKNFKIFLLSACLLAGAFFCWSNASSATDYQINVSMNVTSTGGGGTTPGGGGDTDNVPTITNVASSTTNTTASVSWTASDDKGIVAQTFAYSTDQSYSTYVAVTGSGQVSLTGLAVDTEYNFKIEVRDVKNPTTTHTGVFKTTPTVIPPDTTAPTISNIKVIVGITSTSISWVTNEPATAQLDYQRSGQPKQSVTNSTLKSAHGIGLTNLLPNTIYSYWIKATDAALNTASTNAATFTTLKDSSSPPNVTGLAANKGTNVINLSWTNPNTTLYPDFVGVKILRKINSASANSNDGTLIYTGSGQSTTDSSFLYNTLYYYTAFSYDTSLNYSSGISDSINYTKTTPTENCTNGIDDDGDGLADCADGDCSSHPSCLVENCTNGIDDDGDGLADCADGDCSSHPSCQTTPPLPKAEVCDNGIDDDKDGAIDCNDSDCVGFAACSTTKPPGGGSKKAACQDLVDNDNDGLIDFPSDPGCISLGDDDEYNPKQTNVPGFIKLNLKDVKFVAGNGQIPVTPVGGIVNGLAGGSLRVSVPKNKLASTPSSTVLRINGSKHNLILDNSTKEYYTIITFPGGNKQAYLEVDYGSNQFDSVAFKINSLVWGDILDKNSNRLSGTKVVLHQKDGQVFNLNIYGQKNPWQTDVNGIYGWMVPNGQYYIAVNKDGYYERKTPIFTVNNNIVNQNIKLVLRPKKIKDIINPNAGLTKNIGNVAKNLGQKTVVGVTRALQGTKDVAQNTARVVQEVADDPKVEKAAERVVAPATVGVVSVGILPFLSWSNLLPLLRLLFLQPLMLLGWGRRRKWGLVYNSLNKVPVDLAIVRLLDARTGKLVQSKVTDRLGRYIFITKPGEYKMEIKKSGFVYPSELLLDYKHDGRRADIYHGEAIKVAETNAVITANVPLDPSGEHEKPARLIWQKIGRRLQTALAIAGIIITAVSLYISPKWYVAVLLLIHLGLFWLFKRLSAPRKIKSWGIVYDESNKKPVGKTIARLFNARFNKLISTQITDRKGRYQFLAGDDDYYVTYEHKDYKPERADVNLKGDKEDVVDVDVDLEKKN